MTPISNRRPGLDRLAVQGGRPTRPVMGSAATKSHPLIGQTADAFERILRALGIKLDDIKDPAARLADRVAKLREALEKNPGLAERLEEQFPQEIAALERLRPALEAILPQLSPEDARVVNDALRTMDMLTATGTKPTAGPLGRVEAFF